MDATITDEFKAQMEHSRNNALAIVFTRLELIPQWMMPALPSTEIKKIIISLHDAAWLDGAKTALENSITALEPKGEKTCTSPSSNPV